METESSEVIEIVTSLRNVAQRYYRSKDAQSAVFWYEQLIAVTEKQNTVSHADYSSYLTSLMDCELYERIITFIECRLLMNLHIVYQFLLTQALYKTQHYDKLIKILTACNTGVNLGQNLAALPFWMNFSCNSASKLPLKDANFLDELAKNWLAETSLLLTIGRTYLCMDNRVQAVACLKQCLKKDAYCFSALETLLNGNLLGWKEKRQILEEINKNNGSPSSMSCMNFDCESCDTAQLAKQLYATKLGDDRSLQLNLRSSLSMKTCAAEILTENAKYKQAIEMTTKILKEDEFYWPCIPVHICLLLELGKLPQLFLLAHRLVDCFPDNSLSWFAVGAYYYANSQYEAAKKFLAKCTSMKSPYGAGWLLFGHSFAMEREHDQAMNCYFKAAQVLSGSHLPLLYIGLEYSRTNNTKLGDKFLQEAESLAPKDPFVLNEIASLAFDIAQYQTAFKSLLCAHLAIVNQNVKCDNPVVLLDDASDDELLDHLSKYTISPSWEPLMNNLGQTCRKLEKYDLALICHRKALALKPRQASTYGSIGLTQLLMGDVHLSITSLHQALSLNRDSSVLKTLLTKAMDFMQNSKECNTLLGLPGPSDSTSSLWMHDQNTVPLLHAAETIYVVSKSPRKSRLGKSKTENRLGSLSSNSGEMSMEMNDTKNNVTKSSNSTNNLSNIDEVDMEEQ